MDGGDSNECGEKQLEKSQQLTCSCVERLESPAADSTHGPGQNETLSSRSRLAHTHTHWWAASQGRRAGTTEVYSIVGKGGKEKKGKAQKEERRRKSQGGRGSCLLAEMRSGTDGCERSAHVHFLQEGEERERRKKAKHTHTHGKEDWREWKEKITRKLIRPEKPLFFFFFPFGRGFLTCFSLAHVPAANTAASDWPGHHHQPWTVATHSLIGTSFWGSLLLGLFFVGSSFFIIFSFFGWCFSFSCFTILNGPVFLVKAGQGEKNENSSSSSSYASNHLRLCDAGSWNR